jgi:predicted glycogen debranching enzyme
VDSSSSFLSPFLSGAHAALVPASFDDSPRLGFHVATVFPADTVHLGTHQKIGSEVEMTACDCHEWLETDGLGGFASGTASGVRTRRYHALLLVAATPPTGRMVLVNGLDAWIETPSASFALTSQRYDPGVVSPDGIARLGSFTTDPWPTWRYVLEDGTQVAHALTAVRGAPAVVVSWAITQASGPCTLSVRPFLSGRDYHSLQQENGAFRFPPERRKQQLIWRPYDGVPAIEMRHDGDYEHQPDWYRRFLYTEEAERGLDCTEDLAAPGILRWRLEPGDEALLLLSSDTHGSRVETPGEPLAQTVARVRAAELTRRIAFPSRLHRAGDDYLVTRGSGQTIVAGYPWFTDWGRDTFIALRGLCLAAGRLDDARRILLEWSGAVSEGMLPNRFPDGQTPPEFNSVDASLWYVIAVHDFLTAAAERALAIAPDERDALLRAVDAIVDGYAGGTRFGIRADTDGLLASGAAGAQLTWMDAKIGDWVVTPRIGKPVEIQALWLNALWLTQVRSNRRRELLERGVAAFNDRFWDESAGHLYDVVDVGHVPGTFDASLRPNQLLALGGLPLALVTDARAQRVLDVVESHLLTPLGLRSLSPGSPGYAPAYTGNPAARDAVYHQGTVWPWLLGAFVEAWVRSRGNTERARIEARERFVAPLLRHLDDAGLNHISEIADADAPHTPRGCPFQAWSVGELLRLDQSVLAVAKEPA